MAKLPGFNLELMDSPDGPLLSLGDPECRGLCRLVNAIVTGEIPDLVEQLKNHRTITLDGAKVGRPPAALDLRETREGFIERTGRDPDEEGGFVVVDGEPYPIYTFEDMSWALAEARTQWSKRRTQAAELGKQEERAARLAENPPDPLFCVGAAGSEPSSGTREFLTEVEKRARLVDKLDADPETHKAVEAAATLSAKRRFLQVDLFCYGLLDDKQAQKKLRCLDDWDLPTLAGYLRAAVEHAAYQRSPDRAEMAPGEPIRPILFSPISVDWFRKPTPIPPKVVVNRLKWTAWCEREAVQQFENESSGSGWWIWHSGSVTHTFFWRYENGETRVLYKVT